MEKYFVLGLLFTVSTATMAKTIYLISLPRSTSTAFLRMMRQRQDHTIINEPGAHFYITSRMPSDLRGAMESTMTTFDDVRNYIIELSKSGDCFVKEMAFAANEYVFDPQVLADKDVYFVFLIRDPHCIYLSFYKALPSTKPVLLDVLSYQLMYELYKKIEHAAVNKPLIITSEELCAQPDQVIQIFCQHVGISFKQESMEWENLGHALAENAEWCESKDCKFTDKWNGNALKSTGFVPQNKTYACDSAGVPTFEEIANLEHREFYKNVYTHNLPYYHLLVDAYAVQIK